MRVVVTGLVTFSVIAGVWVALISQKYGKFTTARPPDLQLFALGASLAGPLGSTQIPEGRQNV